MTRYIDAEEAITKCNLLIDNADSCPNPYGIEGIEIVRDLILNDCPTGVPTADVVEVVRCKDCKFQKLMDDGITYACLKQTAYRKPTDFCSYGERK